MREVDSGFQSNNELLAFVPRVGVAREVRAVAPHQERAQLLGGSVGHRRAPGPCIATGESRREGWLTWFGDHGWIESIATQI
jgi:hypothetical protein